MAHGDTSTPVWSDDALASDPHRAPDKASRVRAMFADIAHSYDRNNRVHSFGRDQAWRRRAVAAAGLRPTDDALDVACGTGDLTEALADGGPRSVVGLDFTPEMLEIARRKSAAARGDRRPAPRYVAGDAMDLPFADESFDVVTIAFGLRNVADAARAAAEFRRVLRPGGRLIILEFGEPRNPVLRLGSRFYTEHVMPRTATWIARDRSGAYRYLPRSIATFLDRPGFQSLLEAAGFDRVGITDLTLGICLLVQGQKPDVSSPEPAASPLGCENA